MSYPSRIILRLIFPFLNASDFVVFAPEREKWLLNSGNGTGERLAQKYWNNELACQLSILHLFVDLKKKFEYQ